MFLKITPFGDETFLYEDMKLQYPDFFLYFKHVLQGRDAMFYSINCGMGSDMIGFWTYYLLSPYNFLFFLIPDAMMPAGITILLMLKVSTIGLTTWIFLDFITNRRMSGMCVVLSSFFAFGTWVAANMTNPMWLDPVILLPVLLIFLIRMVQDDSPERNHDADAATDADVTGGKRWAILYVATVVVMIITNYYIAAMNLLFLSIFMVLLTVLGFITRRKLWRYILMTGIGCVLDLWLLIPTVISLLGSEKSHTPYIVEVMNTFLPSSASKPKLLNPIIILPKLFSTSYNSLQIMEGQPDVYVGMLPLILTVAFFLNKKIAAKIKIAGGACLAITLAFFCIKELNLIAHFGTEPYGYLYRYAYVWAFICVVLACICLMNPDGMSVWRLAVSGGVCLLLLGIAAVFVHTHLLPTRAIVLNAVMIVVEAALLMVFINKKSAVLLCLAPLTICFMIEAGWNMKIVYNMHALMSPTASEYASDTERINRGLETIREYEQNESGSDPGKSYSSYRIESFPHRNANDSLSFAYKSVSAYNSLLPMEHRILLYKLGYNDNGLFTDYDPGNTRVMDAMLGVRYIMTDGNYEPSEGQHALNDTIIINDSCLGADIITGKTIPEILDFIEASETENPDASPFDLQELLWNRLTGRSDKIFTEASVKESVVKSADSSDEESAEVMTYSYEVTASEDGCLYFYMDRDALNQRNIELDLDGEMLTYYGNASCQEVVSLGYHKAGDIVQFAIRCVDDNPELPSKPVFVTEDISIIVAYCKID
ncbi:MAG: YfhO family protein [Lachnospiraceae bacterium]|nr:YfhO family protein [Lachnospiraceae bacterium]